MTRAGESTSFDAITKYVALNGLRPVASTGRSGANGSQQNTLVALVDEAQDLSAAQVEYFVRLAAALGLLVIFVGDGVQTIYKFRGTDSIHYANLARGVAPSGVRVAVKTRPLATCFRCPEVVVGAANLVLVGKANSDQLGEFVPYTLRPAAGAACGELLKDSLLVSRAWETDGESLVAVLGRTRLSILAATLELLALDNPPTVRLDGTQWSVEIKIIRLLLEAWAAEQEQPGAARVLRLAPFAQRGPQTWPSLEREIIDTPLKSLMFPLGVVNTYGYKLAPMLNKLDAMLAAGPRLDANVLLTTVHAAKGAEFDTVELLDDFLPLSAFEVVDGRGRMAWRAGNDEINLWYVALTRAKRRLVVPAKFLAFVQDMRSIGAAGALGDGVGCPLVLGSGHSACSFPPADIVRLREDLYVPWVASGGGMVLSQLECTE